jgi:hypothetical protein
LYRPAGISRYCVTVTFARLAAVSRATLSVTSVSTVPVPGLTPRNVEAARYQARLAVDTAAALKAGRAA